MFSPNRLLVLRSSSSFTLTTKTLNNNAMCNNATFCCALKISKRNFSAMNKYYRYLIPQTNKEEEKKQQQQQQKQGDDDPVQQIEGLAASKIEQHEEQKKERKRQEETERKKEKEQEQAKKPQKAKAPIDSLPNTATSYMWTPPKQPEKPRSLNVSLLGLANAGKSTLVNQLVGTKVSIVSPKAQTTRGQILGICTHNSTQLVFYDTPGIASLDRKKRTLKSLATVAWDAVDHCDIVLLVVDAARVINGELLTLLKHVENNREQVKKVLPIEPNQNKRDYILVLNKIDLIHHNELLPKVEKLNETKLFKDTFIMSALEGFRVDELKDYLLRRAVPRPWLYSAELSTIQPDYFRASEVIREKIFKRLNLEVPYIMRQVNVGWTTLSNGALRIDQNIVVPKFAQKIILIGKKGTVIQQIAREAKDELETIFNRRVALHLAVQHKPNFPFQQREEEEFE